MTQLRARAIGNLVIWGLAMIGLMIVFFGSGGPASFLDGKSRVTLTRIIFTVAFILDFLMLYLTRGKKHGGKPKVRDERDEQIERKSLITGFYVVGTYVFLFAMALYWYYKVSLETTQMPVGWVWFLGISCFFVGMVIRALVTLALDLRMSGHA